jgi:hypothetical protein
MLEGIWSAAINTSSELGAIVGTGNKIWHALQEYQEIELPPSLGIATSIGSGGSAFSGEKVKRVLRTPVAAENRPRNITFNYIVRAA